MSSPLPPITVPLGPVLAVLPLDARGGRSVRSNQHSLDERRAVLGQCGTGLHALGSPPAIRSAFLARQRGLLAAEIEILRPTLVVFVSGPHYDVFVSEEFPGCQSVALAPFPIRQAARFTHPALPAMSFRSYHPGYLNRNELCFRPIRAMVDLYLAERST